MIEGGLDLAFTFRRLPVPVLSSPHPLVSSSRVESGPYRIVVGSTVAAIFFD